MERAPETVVAVLGLLKAGGVYLPLDPDYPADRLTYMLQDVEAAVILTVDPLKHRVPCSPARLLTVDTVRERCEGDAPPNPRGRITRENLAAFWYTSGSTGVPKAVMVPHRVCCTRLFWSQAHACALTANDRGLLTSAVGVGSFIGEMFWSLMTGGQLVIARPGGYQDVDYLVGLVARHEITIVYLVPSVLRLMLAKIQEKGLHTCKSLKNIVSLGEVLPPDLQDLLIAGLGADLHNYYGLTEFPTATYWKCQRGENRRISTIGRPTDGNVYLLDEGMKPVPPGTPGEIFLSGPGLTRGYLHRPDLTAERYLPDPFSQQPGTQMYRTGDVGRLLPDGVIEFLGRLDEQVKLHGLRIELGEIESVLNRHPAIYESAAMIENCGSDDEGLVACVVLKQRPTSTRFELPELRRFLKGKLPDFMVPGRLFVTPELPRNASGKLDRQALSQTILSGETVGQGFDVSFTAGGKDNPPIPPSPGRVTIEPGEIFAAPATPLEQLVAGVYQEVLETERVGIYDNFFDLGGHSMLAMKAIVQLEAKTGLRIKQAELFAQTLGQLASSLEERLKKASTSFRVNV
jgi:amino acid adenylation domain-containing protein